MSPGASLKTMHLPAGFHIELVASEPMIRERVMIAWDGDGKMYVAQMNTYMQDIDATDEGEPWSRISVLEDTTGDGRIDKSVVLGRVPGLDDPDRKNYWTLGELETKVK